MILDDSSALRIIQMAGYLVWRETAGSGVVEWNDAGTKLLRTDTEEGAVFLSPDWKTKRGHADATYALGPNPAEGDRWTYPFNVTLLDGSERVFWERGGIERDANGKIVSRFGIIIDITDHANRHADLARSEERFRAILENAPVMIDSFTSDGRCTLWNPECERVLGYSMDELNSIEGNPLSAFYPDPEDLSQIQKNVAHSDGKFRECRVKTRDGSERVQMWADVFLSEKHGFLGIGYDVTEQKLAEREIRRLNENLEQLVTERTRELKQEIADRKAAQQNLVQSSKMAALGEMAGGIAHEINNPLSVIQGRVHMLRRKAQTLLDLGAGDPASMVADCTRIEETIFRISRIIQGLRTFAHDAENEPFSEAELATVIQGALDLCAAKLGHHRIALTTHLPEDPVLLSCRVIQVQQVLVNLLNNAFDAVRDRKGAWIRVEARLEGRDVTISVIDSGAGVSAEIQNRIMDPFFTTKEIGQGTGLGLSISRSIAESHGGDLRLDPSHPNTCFVLELRDALAPGKRPGLAFNKKEPAAAQSGKVQDPKY